jgi:ABC-type sugar transport system permease subunit
VYSEAFVGFNAGRAATYATILFGLMLAITVVQIRMVEKRVTYE